MVFAPPSQGDRIWNFAAARRHRHRRAGARAAAVFSPPPLGAPASRRPRAKRERGRGPSARQAGGTPALPGSSRMSRVGKAPVRAAAPLGSTPLPTSPLPGGRREDGAAHLPVRPSRAVPNGAPDSSPLPGRRSEGGLSSAIALPPAPRVLTIRARFTHCALAAGPWRSGRFPSLRNGKGGGRRWARCLNFAG